MKRNIPLYVVLILCVLSIVAGAIGTNIYYELKEEYYENFYRGDSGIPPSPSEGNNSSSGAEITPQDNNGITIEQAKEIALKHAGATESQVKYSREELEYDDGRQIYDIEFFYNNLEHSYEISATDGKIVDYDIDRD